jgi:hypothetical protein
LDALFRLAVHPHLDLPIHPRAPTAKDLSHSVREQMQQAIDQIRRRRRSVFWGSVFGV